MRPAMGLTNTDCSITTSTPETTIVDAEKIDEATVVPGKKLKHETRKEREACWLWDSPVSSSRERIVPHSKLSPVSLS